MRRTKMLLSFCTILALTALAIDASARDWFVRAGATGGDGSKAKPFGAIWQGLDGCLAGDKIHVSQGKYYGKLETGSWVIPWPRVELLGGYNKQFTKRNPWKYRSELLWKKGSKNRNYETRVLGSLHGHEGVALDGFVIDMQAENNYRSDGSLKEPYPKGAVRIFHKGSRIANNIILNSAKTAIKTGMACTVENNLIVNQLMNGIEVVGSSQQGNIPLTVIKNNTILFTWDNKAGPGTGATRGLGINTKVGVDIENNLIGYTDNNAVVIYRYGSDPLSVVSLKNNVFFMNSYSNFKFQLDGKDIAIDNSDMDSLEDLDFKDQGGNLVANPRLRLDKAWMDKFSRRKPAQAGKVTMDDMNKARRELGLPLIAKGGRAAQGVAPAWKLASALKLMAPGNKAVKAGARAKDLPVVFTGDEAPVASAPKRDYQKAELKKYVRDARSVDGKPLEMIVALGTGVSPRGMDEVKNGNYKAIYLCVPEAHGTQIYGWYPKGTPTQKFLDPLAKHSYGCSYKPERVYRVRGVIHAIRGVPKAGFMIDSVELYEPEAKAAQARPKGRDWFVRAGAKHGDGSLRKPFKDPYKALKKAKQGDTIHVAEGTYTGFMKSGSWKIGKKYLAMLGGYDKAFKTRDPWRHPTLLKWPKGAKTDKPAHTLSGDDAAGFDGHTGFILDGFVFDRRDVNKYKPNGDLAADISVTDEAVRFWSPGVVVRNCVFVNGAGAAVRLSGGDTLENNIFINHAYHTIDFKQVQLSQGPIVVKNNTILFTWNKTARAGKSESSQGYGLMIQGAAKAVVEGNVFQFIDNAGIKLEADAKDVVLKDNVFSQNLFADLKYKSGAVVDNKTMNLLAQLGFKSQSGNKVVNPNFAIDGKWFDAYLKRTAGVPGKVKMDEWNQVRELLGRPVIATGGKAGVGFAPAYDWKKALTLFPRAKNCRAGAKHKKFQVSFGN
jgi:hypothetical protein